MGSKMKLVFIFLENCLTHLFTLYVWLKLAGLILYIHIYMENLCMHRVHKNEQQITRSISWLTNYVKRISYSVNRNYSFGNFRFHSHLGLTQHNKL
jgi:hypothetical protein